MAVPLELFLRLHPPMRTRVYSISSSSLSSPLSSPTPTTSGGGARVSLTFAVLDEPSLSSPTRRHQGAASTYLASLRAGDTLSVAVRKGLPAFRLPAGSAAETMPIIMVAAGAGIAPFRGFVQERAAIMARGKRLAPAVLFFGCRGRGDDLYRAEFDGWERAGVVRVFRAYSRQDGGEQGDDVAGCRYVQERVWKERGW